MSFKLRKPRRYTTGAAPYDGVMMGRPTSSSSSSTSTSSASPSSWMQFFGPNWSAARRLLIGDAEDPCDGGALGYVANWVDEWLAGAVRARYRPSCAPTRPS